MKKRGALTPKEVIEVAEWFHLQTVAGVMIAKRDWTSGGLAFQGGTALHLCFGSPRYSEDLDFLYADQVDLDRLMAGVLRRAKAAVVGRFGAKAQVELISGRKDARPLKYELRLQLDGVLKKLRLKVEFMPVPKEALRGYDCSLRPLQSAYTQQLTLPVMIPTAEMAEIYLDKIVALAERPYLKERDIFDMWWLRSNNHLDIPQDRLCEKVWNHLKMYPNGAGSPDELAERLRERATDIQTTANVEDVAAALKKFIPDELQALVAPHVVAQMVDTTVAEMRSVAKAIAPRCSAVSEKQGPRP